MLRLVASILLIVASASAEIVHVGKGSYMNGIPDNAVSASSVVDCKRVDQQFVPAQFKMTEDLLSAPYPTHKWWSSLAWPRCLDNPDVSGSFPLFAYPMAYQALTDKIEMVYSTEPTIFKSKDFPFLNAYKYKFSPSDFNLTFPQADLLKSVLLADHSEFHVKMQWQLSNGLQVNATIGRGLPYLLVQMETGVQRRLLFSGKLSIFLQGETFVGVTVSNEYGRVNSYAIYTLGHVRWSVSMQDGKYELVADNFDFNVLSIAPLTDESQEQVTIMHGAAFSLVTGGSISYEYQPESMDVKVDYSIDAIDLRPYADPKQAQVLFAAPKHLAKALTADSVAKSIPSIQFISPKGQLLLLNSRTFTAIFKYTGVLPVMPWVSNSKEGLDSVTRRVKDFAHNDPYGQITFANTYASGKTMLRVGELALVANELGLELERDMILGALKGALESWFTVGDDGHYFYLDGRVGTLIGYPSSFGSDNELNDHHFHWGYFIRCAAIVGMFDDQWIEDYGGMVDLLIADVANMDANESRFPYNRQFDPIVGHHFASGHAGFMSGNNQEASSESMLFNSALVLWGSLSRNTKIRDAGIYMYAVEYSSIMHYWYDQDKDVYPKQYTSPYSAQTWDDGSSYEIWWGPPTPEELHGINVLPVTPSSMYLGARVDVAKENYRYLMEMKHGQPFIRWRDIMWMYQAFSDPQSALDGFLADPTYSPEDGCTFQFTEMFLRNMKEMGVVEAGCGCDNPFCVCFQNGYRLAYNAESTKQLVTFSDGSRITVPSKQIGIVRLDPLTIQ